MKHFLNENKIFIQEAQLLWQIRANNAPLRQRFCYASLVMSSKM